jgi:ABC-type bacteriocin/lantibiotic exporter with double-glycine peptidase domain
MTKSKIIYGLINILLSHYNIRVSYKILSKISAINTEEPISFSIFQDILYDFGIISKGYKLEMDEIINIQLPAIIQIKIKDTSFVVLN